MMLIFIPWDSVFTYCGIWGFNDRYITGIKIAYLPIEEWLFFPATHYAVVFIYECLNVYIKKDVLAKLYEPVLLAFAFVGIAAAVLHPGQLYSSMKMGGAAVLIFLMVFVFKPKWLSRFTLAFLISLLPFFIMNGMLTGTFIEEEIVWYNPAAIFNVRLGSIPVEDLWYNLFMLLTTVSFYEYFKRKINSSVI
jgi:lycopene cyclase domain-containing protein